MGDGDGFKAVIAGMAIGGFFFVYGIKKYFHKKLIENTPTSKVRSIAMGFVELYGKVTKHNITLRSPLMNKECVYYLFKAEERRSSGKRSYWATVLKEEKSERFFLQDDTGKVLINPCGAHIDIPHDVKLHNYKDLPAHGKTYLAQKKINTKNFFGFKKAMRFSEHYLALKDNVYILGTAQSRKDSNNAVKNEDKIEIKKGKLNKTFFISDSSEKELLSKHKWQVPLMVFGGFALFIASLALLFVMLDIL